MNSSPNATEEKQMHVKSVGLKRPLVCVVWKLGEVVPAQVSSSSLDRGSKLRGPSPKAVELLRESRRH
ncbi:hypothetical protein TNCV_2908291 [Trichonephila clavipes]|nr:hypothetical protein TNCV_2908291 [Trichonephila clavipes]